MRLRPILLVLAILAAAFAAAGMDGYLVLERAKGQVSVRIGRRRWQTLKAGQVVRPGSAVRTGPGGEATFQMGDRLRKIQQVRSDEKLFRLVLSPNTLVLTHAPRQRNPRPLFEMVSGFMEQRVERGKLPVRPIKPIKGRKPAFKKGG